MIKKDDGNSKKLREGEITEISRGTGDIEEDDDFFLIL